VLTVTHGGIQLLLEADDPSDIDGELPPIGKMMALSDVAEEIQMILDNPNTNKNIISAFANDDVDSDVADMILQTLLFGKIIFG
jgi:hypothetical protein